MAKIALLLGLTILAFALTGCVTYSAGVAPSTIPLAPGGYTVGAGALSQGVSWGWNLAGIPFRQAETREAVREATGPGDALINVTVDNTSYLFLLINLQRIRVEGTPVKIK
jgi:hypothetical protein